MAAVTPTQLDKHRQGEEDLGGESLEERLAQKKRAEFVREAESLRRQLEKLEKERQLRAQCRKNGWTDGFADLEQYEKTLQGERHTEKMNLQRQLVKVHNGVKKFQRQLIDVKPTPELIEKLKEIMTEVENSINTFKEDQRLRFEELLKEERTCSQEMTVLEKKMENWSLAVRSEPKVTPASTVKVATPPDGDLPSEVRALESFLQRTGGPDGGWDQYDHQAFLNVWTKHSGRAAYRTEAKLYLPSRSLEEIEQHEDWYLELLYLQDKKREAIQRWRACRQQERQVRLHDLEEVEEEERTDREAQVQAQQHRAEEERREAARRLEEWREQRRRREELEEEKRLTEEIHQRRRAKEERRRQVEVKLTLEEQLRLRREEEEEQEKQRREEEQRDLEERRREAAVGIKRFQERDLHKVETKVKESQQKERQEVERRERMAAKMKEKVEGNISRDRSRLTRPTKGWEERKKHIGPTGGGPVLHMFHRAVPSWRQGL